MTKTCLLIADRYESTADLLVAEMRRRGMPLRALEPRSVSARLDAELSAVERRHRGRIVSDGRHVSFDQVGKRVVRAFTPEAFPQDFNAADRKFALVEAERSLAGLLSRTDVVWDQPSAAPHAGQFQAGAAGAGAAPWLFHSGDADL